MVAPHDEQFTSAGGGDSTSRVISVTDLQNGHRSRTVTEALGAGERSGESMRAVGAGSDTDSRVVAEATASRVLSPTVASPS